MVSLSYDTQQFRDAAREITADGNCDIANKFYTDKLSLIDPLIWQTIDAHLSGLSVLGEAVPLSLAGTPIALSETVVAIIRQPNNSESFDGTQQLQVAIACGFPLAIDFLIS